MAGTGPTDLHGLAVEFLEACAEALDTIPDYDPTLGGAPERQLIFPGTVVIDCCDQLAVNVGSITEGAAAPGFPKASTARINRVTLIATISRCVPTQDGGGNPPPALAIQAAAEQIDADKWALWNHIYNLIGDGLLFDRCCDVIWGPLSSLQPSGGCGGSTLTITVCFDGYEEVQGT